LWKVIMVLPHEEADPQRNTRVIAVVMPNDETVGDNWAKYRVTARRIEQFTGYAFFRNVPPDIAAALRDHLDDVQIHAPRPRPRSFSPGP
jgi:endonuclease G, mitochondrial